MRVRRGGAPRALGLALAGAVGASGIAGAAGAAAPPEPPAPLGAELPRHEVAVSYLANLVHWIDNLAGSSHGKTVRGYRRWWSARFGMPTDAEMRLLRDWVEIRWKKVPAPDPAALNASGCLPQTAPGLDFRQRFRIRSYEAGTVDAFVTSMEGDLTAEERGRLARVIEAFRPRFDAAWREMGFLPRFEESFKAFLRESGLRRYLGEVAAFFGVDPSAHPPGRIQLMALPEEGPTHAQADGRDLLMEIRPLDSPVEQIQVVSHETSHYLWSLVTPERNDAFARQVHAAGVKGPVVWSLLREALPTALSQGLAEKRLAPRRFGEHHSWYHVDVIDRFAKEIFPVVEAAFRDRRRLDDGVLAEIARRAETSPTLGGASPGDYLGSAFFAVGKEMWDAYAEIRKGARVHSGWPRDLMDPEAAAFASRYECLSGVVLVGPEEASDASRLPEIFRPPAASPPEAGTWVHAAPGAGSTAAGGAAPAAEAAPADADGIAGARTALGSAPPRSALLAVRRPAGGTVFFLVAADARDARRIGRAFLDLDARPAEPVILDPDPAPAP